MIFVVLIDYRKHNKEQMDLVCIKFYSSRKLIYWFQDLEIV